MKAKRTMRDIKSQYQTIIQVGYCDAQNLLCTDDPAAYTAGVYGWNADIYPITSGVAICTGYAPLGTSSPIWKRSAATKSGRRKWRKVRQKLSIRTFRASVLTVSYSRRCIRIFTQSAAARPLTSVSAWYDGGIYNGTYIYWHRRLWA